MVLGSWSIQLPGGHKEKFNSLAAIKFFSDSLGHVCRPRLKVIVISLKKKMGGGGGGGRGTFMYQRWGNVLGKMATKTMDI